MSVLCDKVQNTFELGAQLGPQEELIHVNHDLLEIIAAHFAVKSIALHALETPIGEILTRVVVFASILTKAQSQTHREGN